MGMTAVFGSVFVDVKGFSFNKYIPTGRNVGDVKIAHGGVCRNVAENLANVGCGVTLVSMFENNAIGDDVRRRLAARNVDLQFARSVPAGMGMWLAVMDENGNLAGSVSRQPDFAAMHGITLNDHCGDVLRQQEARGLLVHRDGRWALTRRGMDVQNAILVEIMEAVE